MKKWFSFIGATIGGYVGWYLAMAGGFFLAFVASMIGTGIGMYFGVKVAKRYE